MYAKVNVSVATTVTIPMIIVLIICNNVGVSIFVHPGSIPLGMEDTVIHLTAQHQEYLAETSLKYKQ